MKDGKHRIDRNRPEDFVLSEVTFPRRLVGFAMNLFMVGRDQPCRESSIEFAQRERFFHGPNFCFELTLNGLEEPLDQSAWLRFAWRTMKLCDRKLTNGLRLSQMMNE